MFQVRSPVLYFFLLVLGVPFNLTPDAVYERGRFSETFSEKRRKFVPCEGDGPVSFNTSLVLLPADVDPISEERGRERDAFISRGTSRLGIVLSFSTEIVTFHVRAPIV